MKMLSAIMKRTEGWSDAWWLDPLCSKILDKAHHLGLVHRPSVSQVHWTEKGVAFYHKYAA